MRQRLGILVGIIACVLICMASFGCSSGGSNNDTPLSSDKAITAFSFAAAENPLLVADLTGTIDEAQRTIVLAGPLDMAETAGLKARFATTGAQVSVGGVVQESGVTANDFAAPITYRVTAEDGSTKNYTAYVASWVHPSDLTDNISPDGQNTWAPQVAMDNNGNAIIVWQQYDGTNDHIFKSEYRNGVWTHPTNLSDHISPDGQDAQSHEVAMDDNGNTVIVWYQSDGNNDQVFKSEYRNGTWVNPASLNDNISPDAQDAWYPEVAMDDNGNAIIVWRQSDGSNGQIFKSEYRNGTWIHPESLNDNISSDGQNVEIPEVAMDDNGNAIIVWSQSDGSLLRIFKSEYRNGSWIHPANLNDNISPDGQEAASPEAAMDDNGNAVIVWLQSAGGNSQIFKSEYRNGTWIHPANLSDNISPTGQSAWYPKVAMDVSGSTVIVWHQSDGSDDQIFKSEYRNGAWAHPANLSDNISPNGQEADLPQVAMDDNGNTIIAWRQHDGSNYRIFKSEYRNGAWTDPEGLSDKISPDGQGALLPEVAMDVNGNALITWPQYDGSNGQIFKSEYRFWE